MNDSFFQRLVRQIDPRRAGRDVQVQQAQVLCGRWLAVRRLQQGLTIDQLSEQSHVSAEHIVFLETGLAGVDVIAVSSVGGLIDALARSGDAERVARIVWLALAHVPLDPETLAGVQHDLDTIHSDLDG